MANTSLLKTILFYLGRLGLKSKGRSRASLAHLGSEYKNVQPLFITGCERSGTTALLRLANHDPHILLGLERYKFICNKLCADHFRLEVFSQPTKKQTNFLDEAYYETLNKRWKSGGVQYIGDKNPLYFKHLGYLDRVFPDAKYLFVIRDLERVAASYNARARNPGDVNWPKRKNYKMALSYWNESTKNIRKLHRSGANDRIFFIRYEHFFSGQEQYLESLYGFLGLPLTERMQQRFKDMTANWQEREQQPLDLSKEASEYLNLNRDTKLENWVLSQCL